MLSLLLALLLVPEVSAQFADDFSDWDFTNDPTWSGNTDRWTITEHEGEPWLRSDGVAASDTIYLSTPSSVSYGTWSFSFAHLDVNLSNFNGTRVFLMADSPDLRGSVRGYFLQMGTNNSNQVRLYRMDGDPATQRVELGRSEALLDGDSNMLDVQITRAHGGNWQVSINGELLLSADDDTYQFGQYFGVWVKHSSTMGQSYFFDRFLVEGDRGPVDEVPLEITFVEQLEETVVEVWFSTVLDASTVEASRFSLDDGTPAENAELFHDDRRVCLTFSEPIRGRRIHVDGITDYGGNRPEHESAELAFQPGSGKLLINEIMFQPFVDRFDPRPDQVEYVELYNASGSLLTLRGLHWTGLPDVEGIADTLVVGREPAVIEPGGYAVIFAEPDDVDDPALESRLAHAFPSSDLTQASLLPQSRATLGLRTAGDRIRLHRANGMALDQVDYVPEWHHPAVVETRGVALERLDVMRPTNDGSNWTSSVAESGGTPGGPNSVVLAPGDAPETPGLSIAPSPFYPEGSGEERFAVIRYVLSRPTSVVRARIYDSYGRHVRTLEEAHLSGTSGELIWDGLADGGRRLRMGIYVVHLEALDTGEGAVEHLRAPVVLARPLD